MRSSSASRTRTVSSVTERIVLAGGRCSWVVGRSPADGASWPAPDDSPSWSSSSSNGRSKRSLIGQIDEFVQAVTETLDVDGASGFLVGLADERVQAGVGGRRFEPRRKRVEETAEGGVDIDSDDRVVRACHAHVGKVSRSFWQDAVIGCLYVSVGANDRRDLAVQMPSHRDLF